MFVIIQSFPVQSFWNKPVGTNILSATRISGDEFCLLSPTLLWGQSIWARQFRFVGCGETLGLRNLTFEELLAVELVIQLNIISVCWLCSWKSPSYCLMPLNAGFITNSDSWQWNLKLGGYSEDMYILKMYIAMYVKLEYEPYHHLRQDKTVRDSEQSPWSRRYWQWTV